jgi:hypothetical protein
LRLGAGLLLALLLALPSLPAAAAMPEVGLPSTSTTDGKFLGLGGQGLQTVTQPSKYFIGVASGETTVSVGVFDGDLGGLWDNHDPLNSVRTEFQLYADPNRTGDPTGKTLVASATSDQMTENGWRDLYRGPVHQSARAFSGNHFYLLLVRWTNPAQSANEFNGFKIRAEGQLSITPGDWAFVGAPINVGVDPAIGSAGNSYAGLWDWFIYVPPGQSTVQLNECDSDARSGAPAGQPPDDDPSDARVRIAPDVRYTLFGPNGQLVINAPVPSGNGACATREAPASSAGGIHRWNWVGVDAHNLIFVRIAYESASQPTTPLAVGTPPPTATPPPAATGTPPPAATGTPPPTATARPPTATPQPPPQGGGGPSAPTPTPFNVPLRPLGQVAGPTTPTAQPATPSAAPPSPSAAAASPTLAPPSDRPLSPTSTALAVTALPRTGGASFGPVLLLLAAAVGVGALARRTLTSRGERR